MAMKKRRLQQENPQERINKIIEGMAKVPGYGNETHNRVKAEVYTQMYDLGYLQKMFVAYQKSIYNSDKTITFYEDCFGYLARYCAYEFGDENGIDVVVKLMVDGKTPVEAGMKTPLISLDDDDFERKFIDYLQQLPGKARKGKAADGISEQTILKVLRGWRAIAYFAMEKGWLTDRTIKIKSIEPDIKETYTDAELKKLLKNPDKDDYVEYRTWVMIQYMLATGNRIGSLVNLKVKDIDFEESMIAVNEQKNSRPARIPLKREIHSILKDYVEDYYTDEEGNAMRESYLFETVAGTKMAVSTAIENIADYNIAHGVNKTSCHLFRHTFAKRWIMSGGGLLELQKMLNHRTLEMVKRYSNLYSTDIKDAVEKHALIGKVQPIQPNMKRKVRRKK